MALSNHPLGGVNLDNSSGAAIVSTTNHAMDWSGDFTFIGSKGASSDLDLGPGSLATGAVTVSAGGTLGGAGGTLGGEYDLLTYAGTFGGDLAGIIDDSAVTGWPLPRFKGFQGPARLWQKSRKLRFKS